MADYAFVDGDFDAEGFGTDGLDWELLMFLTLGFLVNCFTCALCCWVVFLTSNALVETLSVPCFRCPAGLPCLVGLPLKTFGIPVMGLNLICIYNPLFFKKYTSTFSLSYFNGKTLAVPF